MALGTGLIAVIVSSRAATRLHEFVSQPAAQAPECKKAPRPRAQPAHPNANTGNILIIVTLVVLFSHVDQYVGAKVAMSPFPPAFSICVTLGVIATFATLLSTRTWFTRLVVHHLPAGAGGGDGALGL